MSSKRQLSCYCSDDDNDSGKGAEQPPSSKRLKHHGPIPQGPCPSLRSSKHAAISQFPPRTTPPSPPFASASRDVISKLSDELLVRILSYMDETALLAVSPVSKRFHRIAADSQLWRPHYYRRFILPRAHRIPGFRTSSSRSHSDLHYAANQSIRADSSIRRSTAPAAPADPSVKVTDAVDWRKQYKLRHNWARGACDVGEVCVSDSDVDNAAAGCNTLVKVTDGLAVTVNSTRRLRAWDLRTRHIIAQVDLDGGQETYSEPLCLAVDGQRLYRDVLDIAVGFQDGTFAIWKLDVRRKKLARLYRHRQSFFGELVSMAYLHPYLLTATKVGFISLYSFEHVGKGPKTSQGVASGSAPDSSSTSDRRSHRRDVDYDEELPMPALLSSLKSHSTRPPLTLSIRRMVGSFVASIAYTFNTVHGWSIGIQDLDIKPSSGSENPEVVNSRVAYSPPTSTRGSTSSPGSSPPRHNSLRLNPVATDDDGPIRLCYSHPYLLATMPDNTLVLYLCTSTATTLTISPGLRLWGHTSGISDAEITPRGKAVSVSSRGDEIRVWELEGRVGSSSVEVRPRQQPAGTAGSCHRCRGDCAGSSTRAYQKADLEDRRNWVGFDDEMVIVLKEARDGRESLLVYDFT